MACSAWGATYNWYFSASAGNDSTGDGSEGSPWKTLAKVTSQILTMTNGTDTANIYLKRGDTWTLTSSTGILIKRSNVTIDAYGAGDKPIISGNNAYPAFNSYVIAVQGGTSGTFSNVSIKNIRVINTYPGGGVIFNGSSGQNFRGPGLLQDCEFENIGHAPVNIYQVPNSYGSERAIKIERCTTEHSANYSRDGSIAYWPQAINTNGYGTHGHEARYNVIHDHYGEGIGAGGIDIVEYNVVSGTRTPSIYVDPRNNNFTTKKYIRYNIVYGDPSVGFPNDGEIRISDERYEGNNTAGEINVYGNIIMGGSYGIRLRNQDTSNPTLFSPYGPIRVINNTLIDCTYNLYAQYNERFNSVVIKNNASIVNSDAASLAGHVGATNIGDATWANWTWGPNFFWGDSVTQESNLPTYAQGSNVFGASAPIPKTSGFRALSAVPSFADLYPASGSALVDRSATDVISGLTSYLTTGTNLSTLGTATPTIVKTEQGDNGTDWDFGAIIRSDAIPPDPQPEPGENVYSANSHVKAVYLFENDLTDSQGSFDLTGSGAGGGNYTEQQDLPSTKDSATSGPIGDDPNRLFVAGRYVATAIDLRQIAVTVHSSVGTPDANYTARIYTKTGDSAWADVPNSQTGSDSINTVSAVGLAADAEMVFQFAIIPTSAIGYWVVIVSSKYDALNYLTLRYDSSDNQRVMHGASGASWINKDSTSALYIKTYTYAEAASEIAYNSADPLQGSYSADFESSSSNYAGVAEASGLPLYSTAGEKTFTVLAKIKPESNTALSYIVSKYSITGNLRSFGIVLSSTDDYIKVSHGHTNGTLVEQYPYETVIVDGQEYYIAYSYNGSTQGYLLRIWDVTADAELGTPATGTFTNDISLTTAPWRVGARGDGGSYFDGLIDEVVIISGEAWDSDTMGEFFAGTYGGDATAVAYSNVVFITDPDGTPAIVENPNISISDNTRRYIGLEVNREVAVVMNPESAYAMLTVGTRTEYAYYYRRLTVDDRYFVVLSWDPIALPGDRYADIGFVDVNAFDCNGSTFFDSDDNDLCDAKTLPRSDFGGTGSVDVMVPGVILTSDPTAETLIDGDTVILTSAFAGNWAPVVNLRRIVWRAKHTGNFDGSDMTGCDLYNLQNVSGTKTVGAGNKRRVLGMVW
jgi:hypothetical protein